MLTTTLDYSHLHQGYPSRLLSPLDMIMALLISFSLFPIPSFLSFLSLGAYLGSGLSQPSLYIYRTEHL